VNEATSPPRLAAIRRWVGDETWLKRVLTAQRWMSRAYFEARYLIPDPWRLTTSAYERERIAMSMAVLGDRRYASALEVGCGEGASTACLLDRCDRILAVDFSRVALRRARRRFAGEPRVEVRQFDARVEDPGRAFDLVFCAELFYYLNREEFENVASRMVRWVAPGGDLCLVHGTSIHDADGSAASADARAMSARVLHDRFHRVSHLTVVRDVLRPRYRVTLLRLEMARRG
jgi:SAM-dependent methyltransferase